MGNWQKASEHTTKWEGRCTAGEQMGMRCDPGPRGEYSAEALQVAVKEALMVHSLPLACVGFAEDLPLLPYSWGFF